MAHAQQLQFVKSIANLLSPDFYSHKIIEIGSANVNGSIRPFFPNSNYLGVDLSAGPGVDLICEGDKVPEPDDSFDIAISCECLEHNPNWADTFFNMYRMTKKGGVVIFTCATTGRPEHGTTRTSPQLSPGTQSLNWDYYKNLTQADFEKIADFNKLFSSHFFSVNKFSSDLYFFGYKANHSQSFQISASSLREICNKDQSAIQSVITKVKKIERFIPKPLRKYLSKIIARMLRGTSNRRLIKDF